MISGLQGIVFGWLIQAFPDISVFNLSTKWRTLITHIFISLMMVRKKKQLNIENVIYGRIFHWDNYALCLLLNKPTKFSMHTTIQLATLTPSITLYPKEKIKWNCQKCDTYPLWMHPAKLLVAIFIPLIVLVIKVAGRICIQRLWCRFSHPVMIDSQRGA